MIHGIHHITAITSDAQKNVDFYTQLLGLRFIKKTINFDAPDTYHLYYGNKLGQPGTALTFFPIESAGQGKRGRGQASKIQFSIPHKSIEFWSRRFKKYDVKHTKCKQFGLPIITFYDFDDLELELVASEDNNKIKPWVNSKLADPISEEMAIRGFFGVEISAFSSTPTETILKLFDYELEVSEDNIFRYKNSNAEYAKFVDIKVTKESSGLIAAGSIHHIAFRTKTEKTQLEMREKIAELNLYPTPVINRDYFKSVYFREPNQVIFEIATDKPGFTIDEKEEKLGQELMIPPIHKDKTEFIKKYLPVIYDNSEKPYSNKDWDFKHKFIPNEKSEYTFLLLHGTGGDENDLVPLANEVSDKLSVLSIRGNVNENGMNRFFVRYDDGTFDVENIKIEAAKLNQFLKEASKYYKFDLKKLILFGYSNGANMAISLTLLYPDIVKSGILLHPMIPIKPEKKINLKNKNFLITAGKGDPYLRSEKEPEELKELLENHGAFVKLFKHDHGHEITAQEIQEATKFLKTVI